jgi:hypothetical protein
VVQRTYRVDNVSSTSSNMMISRRYDAPSAAALDRTPDVPTAPKYNIAQGQLGLTIPHNDENNPSITNSSWKDLPAKNLEFKAIWQ